jgi:putative peptidoglycan lipid II flippase
MPLFRRTGQHLRHVPGWHWLGGSATSAGMPSARLATPAAAVSLVRAAATVGSLTLLSRILGFVRDASIAAVLGAGVLADAFFVSFKLANLLRRLFAEGAFNAAFVPLFARRLEEEGPVPAARFAQQTLSAMATILLLVVCLAELFMPWLVRGLAIGFTPGSERFELAVELSRVTFPYLALISLAALFSGVLNAIGRFWVAAFAPVLLNLVLIGALLLASFHPKTPAHALAWGVALAGLAQLAMVVLAARRDGFALRLSRPRLTPGLRRLFTLMLPGVLGAGVYQLNLVVDTFFASTLAPGAISYLFFADRLTQLPLGLIGVALGTALLPLLARQLRAGDRAAAIRVQNRALEIGMLFTLPAAAALLVISGPVIQVLFERGAFGPEATSATAAALAAFATGLPAYVLIKILAPAFFAREDTRTPVYVAAVCLLSNVLLILLLIDAYAHVGIAFATALSNWLNAGCLGLLLWRQGEFAPDARLLRRVPRMLGATALMAAALWLARGWTGDWPPVLELLALCGGGGLVFLLAAHLGGAADFREIRTELRPRRA